MTQRNAIPAAFLTADPRRRARVARRRARGNRLAARSPVIAIVDRRMIVHCDQAHGRVRRCQMQDGGGSLTIRAARCRRSARSCWRCPCSCPGTAVRLTQQHRAVERVSHAPDVAVASRVVALVSGEHALRDLSVVLLVLARAGDARCARAARSYTRSAAGWRRRVCGPARSPRLAPAWLYRMIDPPAAVGERAAPALAARGRVAGAARLAGASCSGACGRATATSGASSRPRRAGTRYPGSNSLKPIRIRPTPFPPSAPRDESASRKEHTYGACNLARGPRLRGRDHRGSHQIPRLDRRLLGGAVLAPEGLHARSARPSSATWPTPSPSSTRAA